MKKRICSYLFSSCLTFSQQNKKSNRGHNIFSYTFSFTLAHIGTPTNFQNKYIKFSAFGLYLTRLDFCTREMRNINSNTKLFPEFLITNLLVFFQYFQFYCRLNSAGNNLFSGKSEFQR